jgi:hypothetical protein
MLEFDNARVFQGTEESSMTDTGVTTADKHYDIKYQLDCGRWVTVEECCISISTAGILCGSEERIRRHVIESLPERVHRQFGFPAKCSGGTINEASREIWLNSSPDREYFYIKPLPEGEPLPTFVFMVYLVSEPISDQVAIYDGSRVTDPISGREIRYYDGSKLIVCWLSDDITTATLPELIKRETRAIEWNKYAVDFKF